MSWEGCWALGPFSHTAALFISLPFSGNLQHFSKTNPRKSLRAVYVLGGNIIKSTPGFVPSAPLNFHPQASLTPVMLGGWGGCPIPSFPSCAAGTLNQEKTSVKMLSLGHRVTKCGHIAYCYGKWSCAVCCRGSYVRTVWFLLNKWA